MQAVSCGRQTQYSALGNLIANDYLSLTIHIVHIMNNANEMRLFDYSDRGLYMNQGGKGKTIK
jgi:hypothetical protein